MNAGCKEKNNISAEKKNTLCGDGNDFFERSNGKDLQRKQKPLAGKHSGYRSRAIVFGADGFFDYANHFLIRGAEINIHTAAEMANTASLPSSLLHRFLSDLTLNFTDLKPLGSIGFTGTPFRKIAPTIDFYFLGGYILVCVISARQIAKLRLNISAVNRPKVSPPPSARCAKKTRMEVFFFKDSE